MSLWHRAHISLAVYEFLEILKKSGLPSEARGCDADNSKDTSNNMIVWSAIAVSFQKFVT